MKGRVVVLLGAIGLAVAWSLAGGFAQAPAPSAANEPAAPPIEAAPATTESLARELRQRLERHPESPRPTRNPFTFGGRGAVSAEARLSEAPTALDPPPPPAVPAGPPFTLSGIASEGSGDALVRTAILSDGRELWFAKPGDALPGGYTVTEVGESAITLLDGAGGAHTLRFR